MWVQVAAGMRDRALSYTGSIVDLPRGLASLVARPAQGPHVRLASQLTAPFGTLDLLQAHGGTMHFKID